MSLAVTQVIITNSGFDNTCDARQVESFSVIIISDGDDYDDVGDDVGDNGRRHLKRPPCTNPLNHLLTCF